MQGFRSIALCALTLGACARSVPGQQIAYDPCERLVVAPAPDATAEERAAIAQAIELWRGQGIGNLTLDDDPAAPRIPLQFKSAPAAFSGIYEESRGEILVNRGLSGAPRFITVAHELGHAMALRHIDPSARVSVMNPNNLRATPTPADVAALRARWGECVALQP